ncbi:AAA+ family ATPase, partial [Candidatus Bipolaricaulota bacterium]|nr:AAA+ family ATPase [Candidatus Bipolaricaulota bacterium]
PELVREEIERRVREEVRRARGEFSRVHPFPKTSQDVPDDPDACLVILGIDAPHTRDEESPALKTAQEILEWRGNQPRIYRNALVFLAADGVRLQDLEEAVCRYLAWESILRDREALNLDPHQVRTAERQREVADAVVATRIPETFQWLLVPVQREPQGEVEWQAIRLRGSDPLAVRASKRLINDSLLYVQLGGTVLRMELDRVPLWRGNHVEIRQLVEDFARFLYLPRLRDPSVLIQAIQDGVGLLSWDKDSFAYAESFDEKAGRYRGLRAGENISLSDRAPVGLLVKPGVARHQFEKERAADKEPAEVKGKEKAPDERITEVAPAKARPKRFYAVKDLDAAKAGLEASQIAKEVVAHLVGLPGAEVKITLEIQATFPEGAPEEIIRIVTENCRTLKFSSHEFESE